MPLETQEQQQQQTETFDAKAYIDKRNQAEHSAPAEPKKETPAAAAPPAEKKETPAAGAAAAEPEGRLPRSARREMNRMREEIGRLTGKLEALTEQKPGAGTEAAPPKKEEDPEPLRSAFTSDADFQRALGRWEGRQGAREVLAKDAGEKADGERLEQFRGQVQAMQTKAGEDIKTYFPDWDDVKATGEKDDEAPEFKPDDHPQMMALLALSDVMAGLYYHFVKEPKDLEHLLSLTKTPEQQIKFFHRLEGKVERLYYTDDKKAAQAGEGKPKGTAPAKTAPPAKGKTSEQRNAELPAPTEAAAATGGSTPATDVKPVLDNGKINPAWKAMRNEREGLRR